MFIEPKNTLYCCKESISKELAAVQSSYLQSRINSILRRSLCNLETKPIHYRLPTFLCVFSCFEDVFNTRKVTLEQLLPFYTMMYLLLLRSLLYSQDFFALIPKRNIHNVRKRIYKKVGFWRNRVFADYKFMCKRLITKTVGIRRLMPYL